MIYGRWVVLSTQSIIARDEILGGTPVFVGTRVPVQTLLDYLVGGHTLDDFLDDFPTVNRAHATAALEEMMSALLSERP